MGVLMVDPDIVARHPRCALCDHPLQPGDIFPDLAAEANIPPACRACCITLIAENGGVAGVSDLAWRKLKHRQDGTSDG